MLPEWSIRLVKVGLLWPTNHPLAQSFELTLSDVECRGLSPECECDRFMTKRQNSRPKSYLFDTEVDTPPTVEFTSASDGIDDPR